MTTQRTTESAGNRYLEGNYRPVEHEVTAFDLEVIGRLPEELEGRYLRNGPNPVDPDALGPAHHWFMGDGMVHGVRLRGGRAEWYRNRYVGSTDLAAAGGRNDIEGPNWSGSGLGPNTSVFGFADTTWAAIEAGACPVELTYELDSVRRNDFFGTLPGAFTAHPKFESSTGELHAMTYAWAQWMDHVQYVVVGPDGRVRRTVDIPLPGMTMLHDMSLTERHAVVYDQPCTVDLDVAFAGGFPFRWDPDCGNRVGLLPRDGAAGDIIWIDVPLGYAFHPLNAYDEADGSVVIDLCQYQVMFDGDHSGPFGDNLSRLERWVLDPGRRTAAVTVIDDTPNEFPRHRESLTGRPHRYGYTVAPSLDPGSGWPTVKHDVVTGARSVFDHGPGRAAGEGVFIARPGATAEDDGWLMTLVHDQPQDSTELAVLDAQDFDRGYVARVLLPQRVPFGFHGNWVGDRVVAPNS